MKVISYDKEKRIFRFDNGNLAYAGKGQVIVQGRKCILKNTGIGYQKAIQAIVDYVEKNPHE